MQTNQQKLQKEQQAFLRINRYIESGEYNKSSVLRKISTEARSQRVIELVFSHPEIFNLEKEISLLPPAIVNDETIVIKMLVKSILTNPANFLLLHKYVDNMPAMVAFEVSRSMHEYFSRKCVAFRGINYQIYRPSVITYNLESIERICDELNIAFDYDPNLESKDAFLSRITEKIMAYFSQDLSFEQPYSEEFSQGSIGVLDDTYSETEKRIIILISGCSKSGKTLFGGKLATRLKNSAFIDSDSLLENDLYGLPFRNIVSDDSKIVIFSDIYAHRFFAPEDFDNAHVVNVLMQPLTKGLDAEHSRYRAGESKYFDNPIVVINDYTEESLDSMVQKVIGKISERLEVTLETEEPNTGFGGKGLKARKRTR